MSTLDVVGGAGVLLTVIAAFLKFHKPRTDRLDLPPEFRPPQAIDPEQVRLTMLRNMN